MKKKILIILAHPDKKSFNGALLDAYKKGAKAAGHTVRVLHMGALDFDPVLHNGYTKIQELEPDLVGAQKDITWAEHIAIVCPVWWGTMPAVLKGFFDRAFLPGFAFKFHKNGRRWDKLLKGRTAHLIITMNTYPLIHWLMVRNAGHRILRDGILKFCGIKVTKQTSLGPVNEFDEKKKEVWFKRMEESGKKGI
ncbi:NAD(P)H-dependent oxidoreductase [Patescibacteria group bacterium]|nr:NAD(P)H-dependent oxidoreductase [Patescibacteria group bacterium]MBU1721349.1 NAD(P)H-dependent oxidoreductase [Patescibacteria group bacterium]MBU1901557.1 NAD(P)H-dependent oxidoreductase [Patescibacteria group bacterium]